ncbi:conserved hypothetical protein [Gloeothece citriformis PCC 7424]|uniref:DUF2993 domain-containing protein n=1 Tax=Gloeothece citriformis (strain PCC 7424) TaxID=65393 RepID=B7K9H5_GLOC7|nr:DUF2993 domain-containing protein [Gloeothece citriformis]ACK68658.1 conserved hypothetical protein [Gloeothece citriformis PCC 7424]
MEWLAIALAAILTGLSPAGLVIDQVVAGRIRAQVEEVETLAVRIDNVPTHQILQGKVDRIRIASRGVYPIKGVRIEAIELESDPINLNLDRLTKGGEDAITESLRQPAQVAVRVVIEEKDVNQAFQSPEIQAQLQKLINRLIPSQEGLEREFNLSKINIDFLPDNRVRLEIVLQTGNRENESEDSQGINLVLETGLNVIAGRQIEITEPTASLNGRKLSTRLIKGFAEGLNQQLDLRKLEEDNIIARIIQFNITQDEINLATFIRVNPKPTDQNLPSEEQLP